MQIKKEQFAKYEQYWGTILKKSKKNIVPTDFTDCTNCFEQQRRQLDFNNFRSHQPPRATKDENDIIF